jgi:hydrogenase maturation protein HypF
MPENPLEPPKNADMLLRVRGIVQGVGFRPFVFRLATRLGLRGWVQNDAEGVLIRVVGPPGDVERFRSSLEREAPPASRVVAVEEGPTTAPNDGTAHPFRIKASGPAGPSASTAIAPDIALCPDCRREMLDPADRRHRYPFINCTQCGPRYSILERLPYDRPHTTMRGFTMCPRCEAEYKDPTHRRFHAQPNACPDCGPRVVFRKPDAHDLGGDAAVEQAAFALANGAIVAVKGIGGYHLMVDARNEEAVRELRRRKHRDEKPFAVMFPDLASVRACADVEAAHERLLTAAAAPVVLVRRRPGGALAPSVAPGNPWVGAFLPYAPLHSLLLGLVAGPLVATSGNLAEEPLCTDEFEAHQRLARIADAFLDHNRPIAHPVDDSVVRVARSGPVLLRRARGYAPSPVPLPAPIEGTWLCAGAQMKCTVGVAAGQRVVLSPHIGDLDSPATQAVFRSTAAMLSKIHSESFTRVACDKHPDYASTRFARSLGLPCTAVQHHLAHVLACLLEHGREPDAVLGVSWDGTGYGEDGTVWGGEFLLIEKRSARRLARLRPFRLPGGEAAVRDGRRTALALAHASGAVDFRSLAIRLGFTENEAANLHTMLERGLNSPVATSAGRLFDAVGTLLGLGARNQFEGQLPLALEAEADGHEACPGLPLPLRPAATPGAALEVDWEPLVAAITEARSRGRPAGPLAAQFHGALAAAITAVARRAGVRTVALTGGCFQNALLTDLAVDSLSAAGFEVLTHRELPPNDGSIAAGQAAGVLWGMDTVLPG